MKRIIICIVVLFLFAQAGMLCAKNVGVPSECEDVMLQAFYWDSYKLTKYGRTKWVDLRKDTAAINANFDLVWFPPSAYADGGNGRGGVGYSPKQYNDQQSDWGQASTLQSLIEGLHKGGTKVIGDIVINHRSNFSNWCDFWEDNFGTYGTFQLEQSHICSNDEGFSDSKSTCYGSSIRGGYDSGTNFEGARDMDHNNTYVQNWAKAYVQWMRNVMKYDGFRYDMTRGFAGKYLQMYNEASMPYLSVSEYWMDDINSQMNHLIATDYNTMVFDFSQRAKNNKAFRKNYCNYNLLINHENSFRKQGLSRYAVTFIDNHDTFEREDNQGAEFIGYNVDLQDAISKDRILQANAYILMLPGIPCVFWPHWKSYQSEINAIIAARKAVGIHSESQMTESVSNNVYEATIQGHRGSAVLRLGANRSKEAPEGYHVAVEGETSGDYTIFLSDTPQGIENAESKNPKVKGVKFIENGQLYIRYGDKVYDVLGSQMN